MPATVFCDPIFPGAKIITASLSVSNASGSYSTTVSDDRMTGAMKAIALEIADPSVFNGKIKVNATAGQYVLSCPDVAGSTTVVISFIKTADDPTAITSSEFDILSNLIDKISVPTVVYGNVAPARISKNQLVLLRDSTIDGRADGLYKAGATIESGSTISAGSLSATNFGGEIKRLFDDALKYEVVTISSIAFSTWTGGFYYADITLPVVGYVQNGTGIVVQSNSTQLWVVSSGIEPNEHHNVAVRVVSPVSTTQTNVQFKVIYP